MIESAGVIRSHFLCVAPEALHYIVELMQELEGESSVKKMRTLYQNATGLGIRGIWGRGRGRCLHPEHE